MRRGEVWWVRLPDLPDGGGGEATLGATRRPVLVLQCDEFNDSALPSVVVALISSDQALAAAPANVSMPARTCGLDRPWVVDLARILTLDTQQLIKRAGYLRQRPMRLVEEGLKLLFALR
jgi:mRNA interferase MazF